MYITPTSAVSIYVFDAKKFVQGEWSGFLGMAIVPASVIFDSNALGEGGKLPVCCCPSILPRFCVAPTH
jgi:hypothetical protein